MANCINLDGVQPEDLKQPLAVDVQDEPTYKLWQAAPILSQTKCRGVTNSNSLSHPHSRMLHGPRSS